MGGIETYSNYLLNFFNKFDDVESIFPKKSKPKRRALRAISMIIFSITTLYKIILKKIDVLHLTNFNLWIIGYLYSLINRKSKIILNIWGLELVYKNKKGILPKIHKFLVPLNFISKRNNFIFLTCSEASNQLAYDNGFPKNKIKTIALGVDKKDILSLQEPVHFKNYFLFAGRIVQRKGISWFVENVLPTFPDYKLIVVGTIVEEDEFNKIKSNSKVEYLGRVSKNELVKLRQQSTAVIIPNVYQKNNEDFEAFAFVTVESVAHSAIVVASKYQGLKDSLLNGNIGYLCEPSSKDSWIETIKYITEIPKDKKIEIINKRRSELEKNFLWDDIFNQTYKLYNSIN